MSYQAPILVVSSGDRAALVTALSTAKLFPLIDAGWTDARDAVKRLQPAAVIVAGRGAEPSFGALAQQVAAMTPYVPLIAIDPADRSPDNAIPFVATDGNFDRLGARLRAALRVRTLHATVLRRLASDSGALPRLPDTDPIQDATVLLIGRGAAYPALSVALGERLGVVGALSVEAAAKHLNTRDLDGIILGEGFSPRVVDAFLTVLSEDSRFRNFPIVVTAPGPTTSYDLPNLEFALGDPAHIVADAMPLIRQHAFEARLSRTLKSLDAGGLLDPRTGLLTLDAFNRDFATAVYQTQTRGGGLAVARFALTRQDPRAQLDAARIISRLMRRMDFGVLQDDGTVLVVFAETDLRSAQAIARRLSSVMKQTSHGARREQRIDPEVTLATLLPTDSARSVLARLLEHDARRAAS
ncbi:MAG: GGDEF domain-containing protein [Rhodopseudomonas sp.]|uniref:GGDEF domain-containing protein n=1 Tax=Rhodopseudomonas sp. TaxID=1078 RepID=UPI00181AD117|nr:GGDEF domain-containing protein [Rhodopseudomonas sp.]NVN86261.1 GGDEF domain-containing protein [Rhodopseudomonas sp.]